MATWAPADAVTLPDAGKATGSRYFSLFARALYTGTRTGEMLGLSWSNLDLDGGLLVVQQMLGEPAGVQRLGTPKAARNSRTLPLSPDLMATLRAWKAPQNVERLSLETEYSPLYLVFARAGGGLVDVDNQRRSDFSRLVELADLPKIRLHDLRHG